MADEIMRFAMIKGEFEDGGAVHSSGVDGCDGGAPCHQNSPESLSMTNLLSPAPTLGAEESLLLLDE
jgi:hypothetical protein